MKQRPERLVTEWEALPDNEADDWDRFATTAVQWQDDAVCSQVDPELFFPEKGESSSVAKALCATCPVAQQCLQFALDEAITEGIWAGTSPKRRRRIRLGMAA